mgnify:CR=1 FL=1
MYAFSYPAPIIHKTVYIRRKKNADYDSNISFKRYNLRSNIDFELSKTTRMSVDMSGQYINRVAPSKTASDIFGGMTLQPVHLYPQIYSDGSASQHPNYDNSGLRQTLIISCTSAVTARVGTQPFKARSCWNRIWISSPKDFL